MCEHACTGSLASFVNASLLHTHPEIDLRPLVIGSDRPLDARLVIRLQDGLAAQLRLRLPAAGACLRMVSSAVTGSNDR